MINSMTGFGRGEACSPQRRVQVEIRCVNHRFLDLQVRLPKSLSNLEAQVREWTNNAFARGRVELFVVCDRLAGAAAQVKVNQELAADYHRALSRLAEQLGLDEKPSLMLITGQNGVLELIEAEEDLDHIQSLLQQALQQAVAAANKMRRDEGQSLAVDLRGSLVRLEGLLAELKKAIPLSLNQLETRFTERAKQWAGEAGLDETRLHQEMALLLAKMDVHEELARMSGHMEQIGLLLALHEPVGKRLDFLAQELHREITTFSNKLQGQDISRLVVEAKAEIEKIREQAQNVE